MEATGTRIDALRRIVANHQHEQIDGYLVDASTASLLVQIHDKLGPDNQARFGTIELRWLVEWAWTQVRS